VSDFRGCVTRRRLGNFEQRVEEVVAEKKVAFYQLDFNAGSSSSKQTLEKRKKKF
jgi:hypothetical protein